MLIRAGFLPLLDAAILVAARELGFADDAGIDLQLTRETSWANVRDRLAVGQFDVAHCLAPLPIAQNLGLSPLPGRLVVPFALGLGGNAVTVSNDLSQAMMDNGDPGNGEPRAVGKALKRIVEQRKASGVSPLIFAVVHNYSGHAYELRYWLAACGIDPEKDVSFTIVPPPLMNDALKEGGIDGFCVGEPWNSAAVAAGLGRVVTTKAAIWRSSPEKVLAVRESFATQSEAELQRLLLALHLSAVWCDDPANHDALARMLSAPHYLGVDEAILLRALSGRVVNELAQPDFLIFSARAANFPWISHALWFYSQMLRWKQVAHSDSSLREAAATYRPDIYRKALTGHGVALPSASSKVEGSLMQTTPAAGVQGRLALGPDGFFDGVTFDPDRVIEYVAASPFYGAPHKI
jgi:ABC-type nitrate/sulfonate/bicarbonate transport system substrate-binding protein